MAVTPRADGQATVYFSNAKTKTVTKPSGIAIGDTVLFGIGEAAAHTWTMPAGAVKVGPTIIDGPAGNAAQLWLKRATSSEPAQYTLTASANTYAGVTICAYQGAVDVGAISRWAGQANPPEAQATFPALDVPTDDGMVALLAAYVSTGIVVATPDGFTARSAPARQLYFDAPADIGDTGDIVAPFTTGQATTAVIAVHLTDTLVAPVNIVAPAQTGNAWTGQVVTSTSGSWLGVTGLSSPYAYQRERDGEDIVGATLPAYTMQAADLAHDVTADVTATNAAGSAVATSNAIRGSLHVGTLPGIAGTAGPGNDYTAVPGDWPGETIVSRTYHWLADSVDVYTGDPFEASPIFGSRVVTVREDVVNDVGVTGSATSTAQRLFFGDPIPFKTEGSPWYEPLPEDVPIDAAMTSTLQGWLTSFFNSGGTWYGVGGPYGPNWSTFINYVDETCDRTPWDVVDGNHNPYTATKNGGIKEHLAWCWKTKNGGVPVPPYGYKQTGPINGDRSIVIFKLDTFELWGGWQVTSNDSPRPTIQHGCYIPDVREFIGYFQDLDATPVDGDVNDEKQYLAWGETAAFTLGTGLLYQKELADALASGEAPQHAIAIELPGTNHTARWPAFRTEQRGSTPLPMGGLWQIDPALDPATLSTSGLNANAIAFRKWFIEMAQEHGGIINDTTGGLIQTRMEAVGGALVGGAVTNSFNWGSLSTITIHKILSTIPTSAWRMVSDQYRSANGPQLPAPAKASTVHLAPSGLLVPQYSATIDSANRLILTGITGGAATAYTNGFIYDLTDDRVYVELVQAATTAARFYISGNPAGGSALTWIVNAVAGTITAQASNDGDLIDTNTVVDLDPVAHRWLSFRMTDESIFFEAAPGNGASGVDDDAWENVREIAIPDPFWDATVTRIGFNLPTSESGQTVWRNLSEGEVSPEAPPDVELSQGWVVG